MERELQSQGSKIDTHGAPHRGRGQRHIGHASLPGTLAESREMMRASSKYK